MTRLTDLQQFYDLMDRLIGQQGASWRLSKIPATVPRRGVYFFFDENEPRDDSGTGPRIIRVGTHALTTGSSSSLRQRLSQHRGSIRGGGNHRGSIFRLLVGQALISSGGILSCASWGVKADLAKASLALGMERADIVAAERAIEDTVSEYLSRLTFAWLAIDDEPGPNSLRSIVERNSIALLSNFNRPALDPATAKWLGRSSDRPLVASSGLWNQRHVAEEHDPAFLAELSRLIGEGAVK